MGNRARFEFVRIAPPEEIAEYLTSFAGGLKRGEVMLESGERRVRLVPAADLKLELAVKQRDDKGRIEVQISWRRGGAGRATDLQVQVGGRSRS
jgi:amphi-Trp domain-containing protein